MGVSHSAVTVLKGKFLFGCNVPPAFAKTKHWSWGWKTKKRCYTIFSAQVCAVENYEDKKPSKNYGYPRSRQSKKQCSWKRGITQSLGLLEMYYRALNRKHFEKEGYFLSFPSNGNCIEHRHTFPPCFFLFLEWLNVHKVTNYVLHCSSSTS